MSSTQFDNSKGTRIAYITVLRCAACFCIVLLHCAMAVYMNGSAGYFSLSEAQIQISRAIELAMNWAVPCFVMMTGALLLDPDRNVTYKKIFTSYLPRMLAAIVVFSLLFALVDALRSGSELSAVFKDGLLAAATDGSWVHMWYLYMMVAVYLCLPIFRKVAGAADKKDMLYILVLLAIFLSLADIYLNGCKRSEILANTNLTTPELASELNTISNPPFYIFFSKIWILYLFLGYALHKDYVKVKNSTAIVLTIVGLIAIVLCVRIVEASNDIVARRIAYVLSTYNSSPIFIVLATGIYSLFMNIKKLPENLLGKLLTQADKCSFGIYLLHLIPIKLVMTDMGIDPTRYGGSFGLIVFSLLVFILCLTAVSLLKMIPIVKKLI